MIREPLLGRKLASYRLERLLGRGGMGQVYYAWDEALDRPAAIKMLDERYRHHPTYAQRFVQEAKALARWRHEHIVQIYYAGVEEIEGESLYYYAMEYVQGVDLAQAMAKYTAEGRLMPHDDVLRVGTAVAAALDYAHSGGIIHRDVKPANVLIDTHGRVILSDFGLAMDVAESESGHIVGSPRYTAPEQARKSAAAVAQSDLYSLGIMLYEMLVGRVPFDDPSPTSVAVQHVTQPPPPPRSLNPALNTAVSDVLLKALSKAPQDRYRTGHELMENLGRALKGTRRQTDELLGQQLDEYQLAELLGQGGMARIYRGYDVRLKRNVAIKVIDATYRADVEYRARFEREAQAIAQLEHPHIVSLYRYGEVSGLFYMAMQYVDGRDLKTVLAEYRVRGEAMPPADVSRLIHEVGQALDYAHSKGIIHRDIKPSNIMIGQDGRAYLTDFGLALLADTETKGEIFGTPHYMAPEQAVSSKSAVPQSDLYAVGVILYEIFTGCLPFQDAEPLEVAMKHLSEEPPLPHEIQPDIDLALEAVIMMALEKKPSKRPANGAELAAALDRALKLTPETPSVLGLQVTKLDADGLPPAPMIAISTKKRELPPVPAAVNVSPGQMVARPTTSAPESAMQKSNGRSCLGVLLLALAIVGVIAASIFVFYLATVEKRDMDDLSYLVAYGSWPPTATPTPTATPSATATPTMTASPTNTSRPTRTPTATATAAAPTHTATTETTTAAGAGPLATPTATASSLPATPSPMPTPGPTPPVFATREADGAVMAFIPSATFWMGADDDDPLAEGDEFSRHEVTLDGYYMDVYEVTVAQYAVFINELGGYVSRCNGFLCLATHFETLNSYLTDDLVGYIARAGYENYPINNVTWHG
ncbi:MAG: protein kinase, partial [Anaerolineae bacterium]|nr:protein kinase [Anaerolineae bacterium]